MTMWREVNLGSHCLRINTRRFWKNVSCGDGCWTWRGSRRWGCGYPSYSGRFAHRVMWALAYESPIPSGAQVLHKCDNPLCVRPEHLHLGTIADNHKEKALRGRAAAGGYREPTPKATVQLIRELRASGLSQRRIAQVLDIPQTTVNQICTGRRQRAVNKTATGARH